MITVRKLSSLPPRTRLRKIERTLAVIEQELDRGSSINIPYTISLLSLLGQGPQLAAWVYQSIDELESLLRNSAHHDTAHNETVIRTLSNIRSGITQHLGEEPADWDLIDRETGALSVKDRRTMPFRVFLEDLRSPFNVGSIFRTSESFGVEKIYLSPAAASPIHPRAARSSMGCTEVIPWETCSIQELEDGKWTGQIFALECGGTPLGEFPFPEEGTVIIGSEELGLGPQAGELAKRGLGIVTVPTSGAKASLNVSAAFAIMMHAWWSAFRTG
jgi:TrmH family RNA methyltransferase